MNKIRQYQVGMTLIEILIALALAAVLMAGISAAISQGLQAKAYAHSANEMAYSARFAMSRIMANVRAANNSSAVTVTTSPASLTIIAGSTIYNYALNATNQLVETATVGTTVTSSVLADYVVSNAVPIVSAFSPRKLNKPISPTNYSSSTYIYPVGASYTPSIVEADITLSNNGQSITVSGFSRIGPP